MVISESLADLLVPLAKQVGEGYLSSMKIRGQSFLCCKFRDDFGDVIKMFSSQICFITAASSLGFFSFFVPSFQFICHTTNQYIFFLSSGLIINSLLLSLCSSSLTILHHLKFKLKVR